MEKSFFPMLPSELGQGGASECNRLTPGLCGEVSDIQNPREVFWGLSEKLNKSKVLLGNKLLDSKTETIITTPCTCTSILCFWCPPS